MPGSEPKVSVVLPTYNRAGTLPRAIASVLGQGFRDFELIVVDDGSDDGTAAVVAKIEDSRLRYVRRPNGGPAAARNTGLREARGEYVAFQDSDDEWLEGKLERQVAELDARGAGTVLTVCAYRRREDGRDQYMGPGCVLHVHDPARQTLKMFFYTTPCWLARRAALAQAGGFDEALRCWEDWELAMRLAGLGSISVVSEALVIQHVGAGVNANLRERAASLTKMVARHGPKWRQEPQFLFDIFFDMGRNECMGLSARSGREWFRQALALQPASSRARLALAAAWPGRLFFRGFSGALRRLGVRCFAPRVVW